MLSPNPLSLLCALLLCLPLALVFTTAPTPTTTATAAAGTGETIPYPDEEIAPPSKPISQFSLEPPQNPGSNFSFPEPPPPPPPPPELPPDDGEDLSLFRRAARAHARPVGPRKVAFMFLTTTPLPFAPLWERFFNGAVSKGKNRRYGNGEYYNIYIHTDPTKEYDPPFSGVFSGRVIPISKPTRRHSPTLVTAARRLLSHALLDDPNNYIFTLLSPSCIPLHSFGFTYKTLAYSKKSFVEILTNETGAWDRYAARGDEVMLPEVTFDEFRIGSQFWSLTRRHARRVSRDERFWRKFRLPCVQIDTCYPEEHYFPTLISAVGARGVVPATLTHVDWNGSFDGHPRAYNETEVGAELIGRLRSERPRYGDFELGSNGSDLFAGRKDPFLFARKFEPECLGPLMDIADGVIFRD